MNAVVMDEAVIGESAIVAACAFVKAGEKIPARSLAVGTPAKVLRTLSDDEIAWKVSGTKSYQDLTVRSLQTLKEVVPLTAVEPNRQAYRYRRRRRRSPGNSERTPKSTRVPARWPAAAFEIADLVRQQQHEPRI